jgi:hypothetical protein
MNTANNNPDPQIPAFVLKDCALIAIATHKRADTLKELRDRTEDLSADSLYYHFWANLLLPDFEEREYINDFASWVRHNLRDAKLEEQLAVFDPTSSNDLERLRYLAFFGDTFQPLIDQLTGIDPYFSTLVELS